MKRRRVATATTGYRIQHAAAHKASRFAIVHLEGCYELIIDFRCFFIGELHVQEEGSDTMLSTTAAHVDRQRAI